MHDRILVLDDGAWLTAGHHHVGDEEHPAIRQPPTEQVVFRSEDRGRTWARLSVMAKERNLVLCEASMVRLPSGRILALLRENSFVFEPMYLVHSDDNGATWSRPEPAALIGHRPTMGLLDDGRLLVTYRNTGPDWGTCAWLGTPEELAAGFRVHGRAADPANPVFTGEGMRVRNGAGNGSVVRYALRPMTDPRTASLTLEAEVRVDRAGPNGCAIRVGGAWWRLAPDRMLADAENAQAVDLPPGRFNRLRFEYAAGRVTAFVNGEQRAVIETDPDHADTRPVMFGAPYPFEDNEVDCVWKRISLNILEPAHDRVYAWDWNAGDGPPDRWVREHVLELRNDRHAAAPDFGYSGWTRLADGGFFCAYHHGGAEEPGYEPLKTAHIAGTRFSPDDFRSRATQQRTSQMERADIQRIFEAYYEKYKKTEGDRTSWSAYWTEMTDEGVLELNLTKCPRGTIFKIFIDKKKVAEVAGWDEFFATMEAMAEERPGLYDPDRIFPDMESII
jgi:hypothetical protein